MRIIKFGAPWCGACKLIDKTLEDYADNALVKNMEYVDVDQNMEMAITYGVRGVPTMVILDENNAEVKRMVGSKSQSEIEAFLNV